VSANRQIVDVDVSRYAIEPSALRLLSGVYCARRRVIPLVALDGVLIVAMVDPRDAGTLAELGAMTGHEIEPMQADAREVEDAIRRYYGVAAANG
jgi:type IV pilus assembly protein PilB